MGSIATIAGLLAQAEAKKAEQEAGWQTARAKVIEESKAVIVEALGDAWAVLQPFAKGWKYQLHDQAKPDTYVEAVWCDFDATSEGIVPFKVTRRAGQVSLESTSLTGIPVPNRPTSELAAFILRCREAYGQAQAEAKEREIKNARKPLDGYIPERAMTLAEAEAAYKRLVELAPERIIDWRFLLKGWQEWRTQKDDEAAEQERLESLAAEYESFYRFYLLSCAEAAKVNKARLAEMQRQLDVEYQVWELEYAIVAEGKGERLVETRTVTALAETPAEDGYWLIWEEGRVQNATYYHLASKKPCLVRPTRPGFGKAIQTPCGYLLVWPLFQERAVSWKLEAVPLPEPPKPPEGLCSYAVEQAQRRARQSLPQDEELEFVPF